MNKLLNHETFEPLYHQLKNIIRGKIETGEWEPGDKISSENDLRNEYKISRNTVQKAVDELVQDGVLERKQGKGTFVSRPKIEQRSEERRVGKERRGRGLAGLEGKE